MLTPAPSARKRSASLPETPHRLAILFPSSNLVLFFRLIVSKFPKSLLRFFLKQSFCSFSCPIFVLFSQQSLRFFFWGVLAGPNPALFSKNHCVFSCCAFSSGDSCAFFSPFQKSLLCFFSISLYPFETCATFLSTWPRLMLGFFLTNDNKNLLSL